VTRTIYRERIPSTDPRLKRHILHDSESRRYAHDTSGLTVASVEHERTLPILDQGNVGSCTAEAGFGVLGTAPYSGSQQAGAAIVAAFGGWDQAGAYRLYSAEENLDGDGPYPPNDNGSTGLTLAKALRAAGAISGWTQTFTLDDALKALTQFPLAVGSFWYNSMFTPDAEGIVTVDPASGVAGGHEYEVVGYDAARGLVKCANSWGTGWGAAGFFHLAAEDLGALLAAQGDVTIFTPIDQPAPTPTPVPPDPTPPPPPSPPPGPDPADLALVAAIGDWPEDHHFGEAAHVAHAMRTWKTAKHL
jgi:hypothetical protein